MNNRIWLLKVNRKKYHFLKLRPSPILKRFLEVESILNFSGACLFKPTWKYLKLFLEALRGSGGGQRQRKSLFYADYT